MNTRISTIKNDIKKLNEISGFKTIANEHARINKELQDCISDMNDITQIVNGTFISQDDVDVADDDNISINIVPDDATNIMTEEQYNENMEFLKIVCETFDQNDRIEDQIQIYLNANNMIKQMSTYLSDQKLETVTIS